MHGGAQERGRRAGTEMSPESLRLAKGAFALAAADLEQNIAHLTSLVDRLIDGVQKADSVLSFKRASDKAAV